jgi:hypothetical protein
MADTWSVSNIRQETQLSEDGPGFRPVFKVSYRVNSGPAQGTQGHVIIPAGEYREETVKNAIDAMVANHHRISNL